MKAVHTTALALLAGLFVLTLGFDGRPAQAAAKDRPVFSEIPGVTSPTTPVSSPAPAARPVLLAAAEDNPPLPSHDRPPASPPVSPAAPASPPSVVSSPGVGNTSGKTLYAFQATDLDLRAALAGFARANSLNIVPDNDIAGTVTLDVRELPLDVMMRALLEASDCTWEQDGGLIRVHNAETRTFIVDYLRMARKGNGTSSATLNSATAGGVGGSSGGGGGGGGAGGGSGMSGGSQSGSSVSLTAENNIEFWKDLRTELSAILSEFGKHSLAIDTTAGIIQVTDRPSVLKNVEKFLSGIAQSVHRQVDIEAKLYDVTLNDQFQFGIDWVHVAQAYGGTLGFGAATLPVANGAASISESALGGLNRIVGSGNVNGNNNTLVFQNFNTAAAINALQLQGSVEVISQPRIRTLNNQTALIKVGTETPFFATTFQNSQSQSGNQTFSGDTITTITVGTILSITPQISENDWVSLDISPVLTRLVGEETSPSKSATAPILDTKQASTLVRIHDGTTIVLGGLIQTENLKNDKKVPLLGDIPGLGKLFTGTFRSKTKKELVMFITPHIVRENETSAPSRPEEHPEKSAKH